ncbi:GyrI-like domain-containing protein [Polaromonas sp. YR568]|uniref:GyrI-like domain-containing protein n=1 Tax=Polaromonas sp. YR568 TaxID=1855301 RepID=UPI00398BDAE0
MTDTQSLHAARRAYIAPINRVVDHMTGVQNFGGGRYACGRFTGKPGNEVHEAWTHMFAEWLPQSGYQPDNKPALELYEEDFVMDPKTGNFSCWLCVPVKTL